MNTSIQLSRTIDDCVEAYRGTQLSGEAPKGLASTLKERISAVLVRDEVDDKKQLAEACHTLRCAIIDTFKMYYKSEGKSPNVIEITPAIERALSLDWQLNMATDKTKPVDYRAEFSRLLGARVIFDASNFDVYFEEPLKKGDKLYCINDENSDIMQRIEYLETRQTVCGSYTSPEMYWCSYGEPCSHSAFEPCHSTCKTASYQPSRWHRTEKAAWEAHQKVVDSRYMEAKKAAEVAATRVQFVRAKINEHAKDNVS